MLQQMRRAQSWMIKGVLWAVVLAFVVTIFYSWGVRSGSSGPTRVQVATIFGEPVGVREFQRVQNGLYQFYRNRLRNFSERDLREQFNFRQMAFDQIVRERLLRQVAQRNGLVVTNAELNDHIRAIPAFQSEGLFDAERYQGYLRSRVPPVLPQQFEAEQRQALLLGKIGRLIQSAVRVTEAEIAQNYRRDHEQAAVRYVTLAPGLFASEVEMSDAELQAHYEENKGTYRTPEQRQIRYIKIDPSRFRPTEEPSEQAIEDYYATHQETFRRPEQVRARHILFKLAQNASSEQEAEVRAHAEAVLDELRHGADFAAAAKAHSEDPSTAERGGDLGFFPRRQMVKAFEEAAFRLPVGELSDLVRTPFGYHIIRVEDKREAGIKSLAEVRQEVIAALQDEQAREAALTFVDDLMPDLEDEPGRFADLAAQRDLTVVTAPFVPATGRLPDLDQVPTLVQRAFALEGEAVDVVEGTDGSQYIIQIAQVQASTIPEFAAVRERVEEDVRRLKSAELAQQAAETWARKVREGTTLEELAATRQLQVTETGLFARQDPVPQLGRLADFTRTVFDLRPGQVGVTHAGARHFVLQVSERRDADMQAYAAARASYRERVLQKKQQQTLQAFQSALQAQQQALLQQGEIVVNSQYVF